MVEEIKREMRKLEHLVGCKKEVDFSSKEFVDELIRSLRDKYKSDLQQTMQMHRLDFFHDLMLDVRKRKKAARRQEQKEKDEDAKKRRNKKKKKKGKKDGEDKKKAAKKEEGKEEDEGEPGEDGKAKSKESEPDSDFVTIKAADVDHWREALSLSKIYYILENPDSEGGIRWDGPKRKSTDFDDKDLVEWRAMQFFRMRALVEWAVSRQEARKMSQDSPHDFADLENEDEDTRKLENLFQTIESKETRTKKVKAIEEVLAPKRKFKFTDEGMEDWTESYSEDSEESGADVIPEIAIELPEEKPRFASFSKEPERKPSFDEKEAVAKVFESFVEYPKYRNPVFDRMEDVDTMREWYGMCKNTIGPVLLEAHEDKLPLERKPTKIFKIKEPTEEELREKEEEKKRQEMEVIRGYVDSVLREGIKAVAVKHAQQEAEAAIKGLLMASERGERQVVRLMDKLMDHLQEEEPDAQRVLREIVLQVASAEENLPREVVDEIVMQVAGEDSEVHRALSELVGRIDRAEANEAETIRKLLWAKVALIDLKDDEDVEDVEEPPPEPPEPVFVDEDVLAILTEQVDRVSATVDVCDFLQEHVHSVVVETTDEGALQSYIENVIKIGRNSLSGQSNQNGSDH